MAERAFTVTELRRSGESLIETPVKFVWTAAEHSVPRNSWEFGLELRTVREDYPGATEPVEQVLGWNFTPFTISGQWDDRYMGSGRALETYVSFEKLFKRGSLIRVEFEQISIVGLIKSVSFNYKLESLIEYQFEFSPHFRESSNQTGVNSSAAVLGGALSLPGDLVEDVKALSGGLLDVQSNAPSIQLNGTLGSDALDAADNLAREIDAVGVQLNQRVAKATQPIDGLRRVANGFSVVKTRAQQVIETMVSARSDLNVAWDSAVGILSFDVWSTGLRAMARLALLTSHDASASIAKRADPQPAALYRPQAGENLYSVSQRFYGTPFQWRLIAERNGLTSLTLTGTELLIIPEVRKG